jgi:glutamine synthetase
MSPREAIQFAREHNARVVDVKFTDLFGMWHHFSFPAELLTEETFSTKASGSTAPPSAAFRPSISPICS